MKTMFTCLLCVFAMCVMACGSPAGSTSPSPEATGTVSAQLVLANSAESLSSVSYTLSNAANTYSGTVSINGVDSGASSFSITGVASGSDYVLTLSGPTDQGDATCQGASAPFLVQNAMESDVTVNLSCSLTNPPAGDSGVVVVNVTESNCPTVNPVLVADNTTVPSGGEVNIAVSATGPDAPAGLGYSWSITAGQVAASLTSSDSPIVTLHCVAGTPEVDTVTVTVTDDDGGCANNTASLQVTCSQ
jgi:hypothetical protein